MNTTEDIQSDYIGSKDYNTLKLRIHTLRTILNDLQAKSFSSRLLRYAEIDLESERLAGRIAPDELYIPLHIIDTNIRREQSSYIQYITQSPRAVILKDKMEAAVDLAQLEVDLTEKLRYDGWQLHMYANIDGFQANGYGIMETTQEIDNPGSLGREYAQLGDFAFIADTRNLQQVEMCCRQYYFTRTKLLALANPDNGDDKWNSEQVKKVIEQEPTNDPPVVNYSAYRDRSLFKIQKVMFRIKGVVQVGWCCENICDNWLREPRPLFLGRRKINDKAAKVAPIISKTPKVLQSTVVAGLKKIVPELTDNHVAQINDGLPPSDKIYETQYPYFLYPYLISENDTIQNFKGRVFLDQDTQTGASSLLSSYLTQGRRASGLYFSKDTTDPNDDFLIQKNIFFKTGALINGKVKEFHIDAPDAATLTGLNTLISMNQQETSQVNFAETNRQQDSRKTATAIKASTQQASQLSGVQVTLFSIALKEQYTYECAIIKSRVLAGLIKVNPTLIPLYQREWTVKPSGDTDVIEKQQKIQMMQQSWPVYQNTAAAMPFLTDLTELMFPDGAPKYIKAFQDQQAQQQSQQAQQMQQAVGIAKQIGAEIMDLDKHPEYFSETGRVHVYPKIQGAADKVKQLMTQQGGQ